MNLNLDPEESDLEIGVSARTIVNLPPASGQKDLQRTEDWFLERCGMWTASPTKKLMACSPKGSRLSWSMNDKVYMFSAETIKYIYGVAMERKTGCYIKTDSTKEMKYGTIIEPLIIKRVNEILKAEGLYVEPVKYKKFPKFPNAGASSDGIIKRLEDDSLYANYEQKACTSWGTHFSRTFELTDEKSTDFWQTQSQMLAWEVDKTYYAVASPPKDIDVYLKATNIHDLYDDWCEETTISLEIIQQSTIHARCLERRQEIAENTIQTWLEQGGNIRDIFYQEIDIAKAASREIFQNQDLEYLSPMQKISLKKPMKLEDDLIGANVDIIIEEEQKKLIHPEKINQIEYNDLPF